MDLSASQRFQPISAQFQPQAYPGGLVTSQSLSATQYNGIQVPSYVPNVDRMESSVYSEAIREDVRPTDVLSPQALAAYLDCTVLRLNSLISNMRKQNMKDALTRWADLPRLERTAKELHRTQERLLGTMRREKKDHDYAITVLNQRWAIKAREAENDVLALEEIDKEYAAKIADCDNSWNGRREDLKDQLRAVKLEKGLSQGAVSLKLALSRAKNRILQSALWKLKDIVGFSPGEAFGDSARIVSGLFPEAATVVGSYLTAIAALTHDHAELDLTVNCARTAAYQRRKLKVEIVNKLPAAMAMETVLRKLVLRTYNRALQDFMDFAQFSMISVPTHYSEVPKLKLPPSNSSLEVGVGGSSCFQSISIL